MTDAATTIDNAVKSNDVVLFMKGTSSFRSAVFLARSCRFSIMSVPTTRT